MKDINALRKEYDLKNLKNKEIKPMSTKKGFTFMSVIALVLIILLIIILSTGCTKDKGCRFYTKEQLYLEHKTGECYYLENGSRQYLEKEQCANYCE